MPWSRTPVGRAAQPGAHPHYAATTVPDNSPRQSPGSPRRTERPVILAHRRLPQLPSLVVLAVVGFGLLLAAAIDWQLGAFVLGLAVLLAAGLRLTLPPAQAGWLVVRTRGLDAAFLLAVGFALAVLASTIPEA